MVPRSELSRETRQAVEDRARQYINEAIAALPPIEEASEPDERPGDAVAEAQRARELADQAEQRIAEEGQPDADARGQNRAAQAAAQRAEGHRDGSPPRRAGSTRRAAAKKHRRRGDPAGSIQPRICRSWYPSARNTNGNHERARRHRRRSGDRPWE